MADNTECVIHVRVLNMSFLSQHANQIDCNEGKSEMEEGVGTEKGEQREEGEMRRH